ncbi:hypothetical protein ScPMuIL_015635 [Solemya velum]
MSTGVLFVINFWKGRRKDKDSPTPPVQDEFRQYLEDNYMREKITNADFYRLVVLPPSIDYNEWLATHSLAFFNHVSLLYGVISEYCTSEVCTAMTGPGNVQYHWYDDKGKKYKSNAQQYVDYVLSFIQKTVQDESIFPTKYGQTFPSSFEAMVKKVHKYLLHILAHIYHAHYKEILAVSIHGHLNSLFTHFMVFNFKYDLLEEKETEVVVELAKALIKHLPDPNQNDGTHNEVSRT